MKNLLPLFQLWASLAPEEITLYNTEKPIWGYSSFCTDGKTVFIPELNPGGFCSKTAVLLQWICHCSNKRGIWVSVTHNPDGTGYAEINGSYKMSKSPLEAALSLHCLALRESSNA